MSCFITSREGMERNRKPKRILATGCRERTARQVAIHGTRPREFSTAGSAQAFLNLHGQLPGKTCVILGSGDIGLIMARRLTLGALRFWAFMRQSPHPAGLCETSPNAFGILTFLCTFPHCYHCSRSAAGGGVTVAAVDEKMQQLPALRNTSPATR